MVKGKKLFGVKKTAGKRKGGKDLPCRLCHIYMRSFEYFIVLDTAYS